MNQKEFNEVFSGLTDRRREVLQKVLNRETNDAIAKSLTITPATVRKHIEEICDLFGIPRGTSGKRYPRRNDLIALFARYKPELLHWDTPEVPRPPKVKVEETTSNNSDSVAVESAIVDSASEDIEALVQKVRSHFNKTIRDECETLCMFNLLYTPIRGNLSRIYVQTKLNASQHFGSTEFSQKRQLWDEVVLRNPKLMVLGKPGAGKTTLLQYIAVHCNEVNFQPKPVPVFVSLKIFAENARRADEIDLLSYIHKKYCRSHVSEQELKTLLIHGKLLFLLDGLDEVPEDELSQVIREIINWANEYSNNRFIVSCRKEHRAYKSKEMGSFIPCEVADFEPTQIQEFIKNWFAQVTVYPQTERTTKANQLIEILSKTTNQRILELANTPLLLHLICLIFEERGDLPSKRAALYKEGIDLLLEKWNQFNRRNQIDVVELRTALRRIADITFEKGRSSFEEGEFLQLIENCPRALSDIEVLSGLLIKKGWKTYAFSHQTFQEYLKAEEIVAYPLDWRKMLNYVTETRWREVFLLTSEMLPNADEVILLLEQGIHKIRNEYGSDDDTLNDGLDISEFDNLRWVTPSMKYADLEACIVQANKKYIAVNRTYKPAAIRVFYFGFSIIMAAIRSNTGEYLGWGSLRLPTNNILELACAIDRNIHCPLNPGIGLQSGIELDYRLAFAFELVSQYSYRCLNVDIEPSEIYALNCDLNRTLDFTTPFSIVCKYDCLESLQELKNQVPSPDEGLERIVEWWSKESEEWIENFRNWIVEHRNIGYEEWIIDDEIEVIQRYFDANKLLVDCLNRSQVSPEVRSRIEDNLFIPLDSSPS